MKKMTLLLIVPIIVLHITSYAMQKAERTIKPIAAGTD